MERRTYGYRSGMGRYEYLLAEQSKPAESVEVTEDLGDSTMGGVKFFKERTPTYEGLPDNEIIGCYRDGKKIAEIWQEKENSKDRSKVTGYTVYPPWVHGGGASGQGKWSKSFTTMKNPFSKPVYPSLNAAWAAARKFVVGLKTEEVGTDGVEWIEESAAPLVESLDAYLYVVPPEPAKVQVWERNVTHNNSSICAAVDPELKKLLWDSPPIPATRLVKPLKAAIERMEGDMGRFRKLDPKNKWGGADDLLRFLKDLHTACIQNPKATYEAHG